MIHDYIFIRLDKYTVIVGWKSINCGYYTEVSGKSMELHIDMKADWIKTKRGYCSELVNNFGVKFPCFTSAEDAFGI